VNRSAQSQEARPLGVPRQPRRRFIAPAAVRLAQVCLVLRIAFVTGLVLTASMSATATDVLLPAIGRVTLPGASTWSGMAAWVIAACVFETTLMLRLGTLRTGSRRVILLVESLVIASSGLYVAAGMKPALVPLVAAIATVVLLRLDHVRHRFRRAGAERRLLGRRIGAVLYAGYMPPDPTTAKPAQPVGYRSGIDCEPVASGRSGMASS
jgi:hypothetical protein